MRLTAIKQWIIRRWNRLYGRLMQGQQHLFSAFQPFFGGLAANSILIA